MKKYTTLKTEVLEKKFGDGKTLYYVKFITTNFSKTLFGDSCTKNEVIDDIEFISYSSAEAYAKTAVKPSKVIVDHYFTHSWANEKIKNPARIIRVFPNGYEKLEKYDLYVLLFKVHGDITFAACHKSLLEKDDFIQRTSDGYTIFYSSEYREKMYDTCKLIDDEYINRIISKFEFVITPIKSFSKYAYDTIENDVNEIEKARNEIIDKELQRINEYKEFLTSLKK